MVCLNHMDLSQEYIFTQEIDKDETKPRITTSFLKFPKNSDFGKNLIQEAKKIIDNKKIIPWGVIGPWFLAEQVEKWDLGKYKWDYKQTCQIPWYKVKNFIDKGQVFDEGRPCLHLFSEMWRVNRMNKNTFYDNGIYSKLLNKHKIFDLCKKLDYKPHFSLFSLLKKIKWKNI